MHKSRPQVTSKLNGWCDWLVNHVPKTIKDRALKNFKDKVMGLYKGGNPIEGWAQPYQLKPKRDKEPSMEWRESPPLTQSRLNVSRKS